MASRLWGGPGGAIYVQEQSLFRYGPIKRYRQCRCDIDSADAISFQDHGDIDGIEAVSIQYRQVSVSDYRLQNHGDIKRYRWYRSDIESILPSFSLRL